MPDWDSMRGMIEDAMVNFPQRMKGQASGVHQEVHLQSGLAGGRTANLTQAHVVDAKEGLSAPEAGVFIAER